MRGRNSQKEDGETEVKNPERQQKPERQQNPDKQQKQEEGYVLAWVIIMVMVLMILVTAVMIVSSSFYRQTFREYNRRQAYLTARSITQTAAAEFSREGAGTLKRGLTAGLSDYFVSGAEECGESVEIVQGGGIKVRPGKSQKGTKERILLPEVQFQLDSSMGRCTMKGCYLPDEGLLILTAEATKRNSTEYMTVYLEPDSDTDETAWTIKRYERGEPQWLEE